MARRCDASRVAAFAVRAGARRRKRTPFAILMARAFSCASPPRSVLLPGVTTARPPISWHHVPALAPRLHVSARLLHGGPRARFDALCSAGSLQAGDAAQLAAVHALQALHDSLLAAPPRWGAQPPAVPGVYLHGGVGRGKTALMDVFYESARSAGVAATREHSHAWMLRLHARLHAQPRGAHDAVAAAASEAVGSARVLCLDELEIADVADAVLLRRAYPALRARGVALVCTSNSAPEALYRGGLNREALFTPLVPELRATCAVVSLDGGVDYRIPDAAEGGALRALFAWPLGRNADAALDRAFAALGPPGEQPHAVRVPVPGAARHVLAPAVRGRVCRFTFEQLCGAPLSAADYLALSASFDAFVLDAVPLRRSDDELRRFITLVDILYDSRKLLLLSADAPLASLFAEEASRAAAAAPSAAVASALGLAPTGGAAGAGGLSVSGAGGSSGRSTTMVGNVEWSATGRAGASLAHLGRGAGSFAVSASPRAASRLAQMTQRAWAADWTQRHAAPAAWTQLMQER